MGRVDACARRIIGPEPRRTSLPHSDALYLTSEYPRVAKDQLSTWDFVSRFPPVAAFRVPLSLFIGA